MRFLYIYGPPASGKLSVAKELSDRLGFEIYDNHVTIDSVQKEFEFDSPEFWAEVNKRRFDYFENAVINNKDLIFTHCYIPRKNVIGEYIDYPERIKEIVEKHKGLLYFVQLACQPDELSKRVLGESRKNYEKLKDQTKLLKMLNSSDYYSVIDYKNSIVIDNSNLSANEAADKIINTFEF